MKLRIIIIAFIFGCYTKILYSQTEVEQAKFYFEKGNEYLQKGVIQKNKKGRDSLLKKAVELYLKSVELVRSKNTIYNLGICYELLGELEKAHRFFIEYLTLEEEPRLKGEVEEKLNQMRPNLAIVIIKTVPEGASIYVDRRDLPPWGKSPLEIAVTPGPHKLYIGMEGYETLEKEIEGVKGKIEEINITLVPKPTSISIDSNEYGAEIFLDNTKGTPIGYTPFKGEIPPGKHTLILRKGKRRVQKSFIFPPGQKREIFIEIPKEEVVELNIYSNVDGATLFIDGEMIDELPIKGLKISPGLHQINVEPPKGYTPLSEQYTFLPNQKLNLNVILGKAKGKTKLYNFKWSIFALSMASIITTAVLGGVALQKHKDFSEKKKKCLDDERGCLSDDKLKEDIRKIADEVNNYNLATDIMLGVSLGEAITTLILFLVDKAQPEKSNITIEEVK